MKRLPSKPSELIRLALGDEAKANRSPLYIVNMRTWHDPRVNRSGVATKCHVCFAGGVMAFTLGTDWKQELEPSDLKNGNIDRLYALDELRTGDVAYACKLLRVLQKVRAAKIFTDREMDSGIKTIQHSSDRIKWRRGMFNLANRFSGAGL